jgi:hypothetical protein
VGLKMWIPRAGLLLLCLVQLAACAEDYYKVGVYVKLTPRCRKCTESIVALRHR